MVLVLCIFLEQKFFSSTTELAVRNAHTVSDGTAQQVQLQLSTDEIVTIAASEQATAQDVFSCGAYAVWIEESQQKSEKLLVRYNVLAGEKEFLTEEGVAQHPRCISDGSVVWQTWQDGIWKIAFVYAGKKHLLQTGTTHAINPDISSTRLLYAQQSENGEWFAYAYTFETGKTEQLASGPQAKTAVFDATGTVQFLR